MRAYGNRTTTTEEEEEWSEEGLNRGVVSNGEREASSFTYED